MEFVPGRASGSRHYCVEEEDTDEPLNHRPSLFPFLPSLSPSPSSSSSVLWGSSAPQQAEPSDWWRHHTSGSGSSVQHESVEKEHMFDKVVTPSDVGKLNRLVIPKQHAERYFPLDASANEKGLLLTFEDRTGKHWRFRYSYWNSSQSYVITKGWSRFVKEKHLDAGDIVSFGRGLGESGRHRLFIDWKPSPDPRHHPPLPCHAYHHLHHGRHPSVMPFAYPVARWGGRLVVPPQAFAVSSFTAVSDHLGYGYSPYWYSAPVGNPSQVAVQLGASVGGGGREAVSRVFDSAPGVHSNSEARTVRLFGVNLGRSPSDDDPSRDAATAHGHPPLQLRLGASDSAESLGKDRQPVLDSDM